MDGVAALLAGPPPGCGCLCMMNRRCERTLALRAALAIKHMSCRLTADPSPPPRLLPSSAQPCIMFVGEKFESVPALKAAKSLLLDTFRGEQVTNLNLAGVDRVMVATAPDDTHVSRTSIRAAQRPVA